MSALRYQLRSPEESCVRNSTLVVKQFSKNSPLKLQIILQSIITAYCPDSHHRCYGSVSNACLLNSMPRRNRSYIVCAMKHPIHISKRTERLDLYLVNWFSRHHLQQIKHKLSERLKLAVIEQSRFGQTWRLKDNQIQINSLHANLMQGK